MSAKPRSSSTKKTTASSKEAAPSHRHYDILGIIFLAISALCVIALISANVGMIGGALRDSFSFLFGKGAAFVPIAFCVLGLTYLRGSTGERGWTPAIGISLVLIAALGFLARSNPANEWLNIESCRASGGVIGGGAAWLFDHLFGIGRYIGFIALALVGIVLSANRPIREALSDLARRSRLPRREPASETDAPPAKERKAVKGVNSEEILPQNRSLPKGYEDPPIERKAVVIREEKPEKPAAGSKSAGLNIESSVPKEGYQLPPISILNEPVSRPQRTPQEMQRNIETIEGTLEQFGIEANVVEVATGPTITRYEIQLGPGIRVARIVSLADNIAMDMAASQVRVEAPIPGKAAIGLEIPNVTTSSVNLRELVETKEFMDHPSRLCVSLGKDVGGVNWYTDLTKMPHLLIAGATNSGKSIGLATLITSLLMRNTPKDVRLVMIDPKRVELTLFDQIPHLLCPVIKDVKEAPGVLRAVWREMDRRYDQLSEKGVRNIDGWNAQASYAEKMPYIVVVIDELADLMIQAKAEVETSIVRLAQLARAVGIHLVIATQRPSVDVITGTIKANIPSRIAFAVASQIDSRTILDTKGADALIGKGDMLFMPIDAAKPVRIQGCYVSEKEIAEICAFWRNQESPTYAFDPSEFEQVEPSGRERGDASGETDDLWEDVVRFVAERGQASTSMIQRRFSIGFQRASRLLDMMEERGIVGPRDGPRPRDVLIGIAELDTIFGGAPEYVMGTHIDDYTEAE